MLYNLVIQQSLPQYETQILGDVMSKKAKRIVLFLPICICLICVSIIRAVCFHKIKNYRQKKKRDMLDRDAQQLYSVIRNPYRIQYGSIWIPQYYLPNNSHRTHDFTPSPEMIQQLQKLRDMPSGECIRLDFSAKHSDHSPD